MKKGKVISSPVTDSFVAPIPGKRPSQDDNIFCTGPAGDLPRKIGAGLGTDAITLKEWGDSGGKG